MNDNNKNNGLSSLLIGLCIGIAVMKRTIVIGSPGAGKSTFARKHRESGFVGGKIDEGRMLDLQGSAGIS